MFTLPLPAAFEGGKYAEELAAATGQPVDPFAVVVVGEEVRVPLDKAHEAKAKQVLAAHTPSPPAPAQPSLAERLAAVEERLDKAANAAVTGEAAKLRDNLKPVT